MAPAAPRLLRVAVVAAAAAAAGAEEWLNATSVQRLAAAVDAAASMAVSSEQLVATCRSLASADGDAPGGVCGAPAAEEDRQVLGRPLSLLGEANGALQGLLRRLRDELGLLFTTGRSAGLGSALADLGELPQASARGHGAQLSEAAVAVPKWIQRCKAPGATPRYQHFVGLHEEVRSLEAELRALDGEIHELRGERAAADGTLAGLEERLGRQRSRRSGEEYELARYLGSSLFRWELLRTKVAHHLAVAFTEARERALEGSGGGGIEEAERRLGALEERLLRAAGNHKRIAERRAELARQLRTFLKSLLLSCEEVLGETPPEAAVSKRFKVLRSRHFGIHAQAAEELVRFLNGTFSHAVPQTVALLREVLAPYATPTEGGDQEHPVEEYMLPTTWKARPKVGRWWEWLEEESGSRSRGPVAHEEFERRFAAAKRRFSVRISTGEPVAMAYLLWLLMEDSLGAARDGGGSPDPPLALPSPADAVGAGGEQSEKPLVL